VKRTKLLTVDLQFF